MVTAKECRSRSKDAEARGDERAAMYWSRREFAKTVIPRRVAKDLPVRVLFRSLVIEVVKPGDRAKCELPRVIYHPRTAVRVGTGANRRYHAIEHEAYSRVGIAA